MKPYNFLLNFILFCEDLHYSPDIEGLAITGERSTLKQKPYEELGLGSLKHRRWYRKLSYFCKFYENEYRQYLFKLILLRSSGYTTRIMQDIPFFKTRQIFKELFLSVSYYSML